MKIASMTNQVSYLRKYKVPPVHPPRRISIALIEPVQEKLTEIYGRR